MSPCNCLDLTGFEETAVPLRSGELDPGFDLLVANTAAPGNLLPMMTAQPHVNRVQASCAREKPPTSICMGHKLFEAGLPKKTR